VRALQDRLLVDYHVDAAVVEADVRAFLTDMLSAGLIELLPASTGAPAADLP
jgi:hypothetical protein